MLIERVDLGKAAAGNLWPGVQLPPASQDRPGSGTIRLPRGVRIVSRIVRTCGVGAIEQLAACFLRGIFRIFGEFFPTRLIVTTGLTRN